VRIEIGFAQAPHAPTLQAIANTYKSKTGLQTKRKRIVTKTFRNRKNRHNRKCNSQHPGQAKPHLEDQNDHKKPRTQKSKQVEANNSP